MTADYKSDEDAKELVELFRSKAARQFVWRTAGKISAVLLLLIALTMVLVRNSLNWSFPSPWLGQGLIGSFVALGSEYVGWGLRRWTSQEAPTFD
jgi:hypothetical protein